MNRIAASTRLVSALCFVLGSIPIGIAIGLIPANPESLHAPRYIVALAGLLFWLAAGSLLSGAARPRLNHLFGAGLLAIVAIVGGWVSIFGTDGWIARAMFGVGAILCTALSVYAFGKAVRRIA